MIEKRTCEQPNRFYRNPRLQFLVHIHIPHSFHISLDLYKELIGFQLTSTMIISLSCNRITNHCSRKWLQAFTDRSTDPYLSNANIFISKKLSVLTLVITLSILQVSSWPCTCMSVVRLLSMGRASRCGVESRRK